MQSAKPTFVVGIQARATSTRLPGKSFYNLCGQKLCEWSIHQAKVYFPASLIYLLVPNDCYVELFQDTAKSNGIELLAGSTDDVLSRYESLASKYPLSTIVRWTGDNPIKCSQAMELLLQRQIESPDKYVAFEGLRKTGVELVPSSLLCGIRTSGDFTSSCSEHVTMGLRQGNPEARSLISDSDLALLRSNDQKLTIDTVFDFRFMEYLIREYRFTSEQKINISALKDSLIWHLDKL